MKRKYPKVATGLISDDWGYEVKLEIKDRRPELEPCINFISSGGRWFFFIPVGLWEKAKVEVDRMISEIPKPPAPKEARP